MNLGVVRKSLAQQLKFTNSFLLFILIKELNDVWIPILFGAKLICAEVITEAAFLFESAIHDAKIMVYGGIVGRYLFAMQQERHRFIEFLTVKILHRLIEVILKLLLQANGIFGSNRCRLNCCCPRLTRIPHAQTEQGKA